jgi:hypothetical protein
VAFTDEELQAAQSAGTSLRGLSTMFGVDRDVIRRRLRLLGQPKDEAPAPVIRPLVQRPRISEVIDLDPQPFAVPIPRPARSSLGHETKCWTALVFTDTHVPYQDDAALQVVYGLIRDVRPKVIVHLGDLLDCYAISRYTKDRTHVLNTQDEIDGARTILHQVSQLAPEAEKVWLEGNHEARLDELLNTLPGTARS